MEQNTLLESRMKSILDNLIQTYDQSTQLSLELNQSLLPPIDPEYRSTYSNLIYTSITPQHTFDPIPPSSSNPSRLKRNRTFSSEQMQASRKLFRVALTNTASSLNHSKKTSTRPTNASSSSSSSLNPPSKNQPAMIDSPGSSKN